MKIILLKLLLIWISCLDSMIIWVCCFSCIDCGGEMKRVLCVFCCGLLKKLWLEKLFGMILFSMGDLIMCLLLVLMMFWVVM